ncbi:MAG: type VI secretion system tip protein TssI/VgrG [Myxococcota bacterium]
MDFQDVIAEGLVGQVRCSFQCERSAAQWHVRNAVVREALARPYCVNLTLATLNTEADPDEFVGATAEFSFDTATAERPFRGVVVRVQTRGTRRLQGGVEVLLVDVELVPALATLGQRINCRIFQDMTVPEIVRDVMMGLQVPAGEPAEGLAAYQRDLDDSRLREEEYQPARDYCVQYKESDLEFVNRLLHEEGIVYVFDQDGDTERVTLIDEEGGLPELDTDLGDLPVDPRAAEIRDAITHFVVERTAAPTRVEAQHYAWLVPNEQIRHSGMTFTAGDVADNERQVYLPNERRVRETSDGTGISGMHDDSERRLALALEKLMADDFVGRGGSNVCALSAGAVFGIDEETVFDRFVALEVVHEMSVDGGALEGPATYENHFVCVPTSRFRAATRGAVRPVMRGPQTATVTGPPNEDIHTDRFGRIKILMHWDREGEGRGRPRRHDATSSAWVPVVQTWAGAGWGAVFIPRVGMEVLVEFLDGNPDCPVVVGCLYNGSHPPPYPLPEQRTASTIRTKSTPDNGGYNELRFEDAAEREEVYLRAQRDYNEYVQRNHGTQVLVDQTHSVGQHRTRDVGGDEHVTVNGNRNITVNGQGEGGFSGQQVKVSDDYELDVAKTVLVRAPVEIKLVCEGSSITLTPNEIVVQAGGGAKMVLNADGLVESSDGSRAHFDADVEIQASTGAEIKLDADARITSSDAAEVLLTADAKIQSGQDAYALFEADKITVDTGDSSIVLAQADVSVAGDTVDVAGDTKVTLEGGGARTTLEGGRAGVN